MKRLIVAALAAYHLPTSASGKRADGAAPSDREWIVYRSYIVGLEADDDKTEEKTPLPA